MKKITAIILLILTAAFGTYFFFKQNGNNEPKKEIIQFSSWGSQSETEILKKLIADYEKDNPSIKIDFIHIPQNYFQKLHLLFASGKEPDVIFINNQNLKLYTDAGLLENLSGKFDTSLYYKQATDNMTSNGNLYAVPRDISGLVVYYNRDVFDAAGIKAKNIKTVEDFLNACQKLKSKSPFQFNVEDNPVYWLTFLSAFNAGIISDDGKSVIINSPQSINALNLYSDLINKYHYAPSKSQIGSMTPAQMFITGKLSMYMSGRWMVPKFRETINFNWDVFEFPAETGLYTDASGWAISNNSKHKKEAEDFIRYLASPEISSHFTRSGLIIPAVKEIAESDDFLNPDMMPKNSKAFISMLENSRPTPVNKNYSKITDITTEKIKTILETGIDAGKITDEKTIKEINGLIK